MTEAARTELSALMRLVAKRVRALREDPETGRSQAFLAAAAGVSDVTLGRFERHERGASLDTLDAFADALGVPLAALLADPEDAASVEALAEALVLLAGSEAEALIRAARRKAKRQQRS